MCRAQVLNPKGQWHNPVRAKRGNAMGSKESRHDLVLVQTETLRERLNNLYDKVRAHPKYSFGGRFDYLWDLKELATMEGRTTVEIPGQWLEEIEDVYIDLAGFSGRGS
jgi:hypothetical protein